MCRALKKIITLKMLAYLARLFFRSCVLTCASADCTDFGTEVKGCWRLHNVPAMKIVIQLN